MKIFISTKKIQKPGRVILDEAALVNAKLEIGDEVTVYFDTDSSAILIEKANEADSRAEASAAREAGRRIKVRR